MSIDVTWLGWSGFLLEGGSRVAVDPHWSSWAPRGALPPWDLTPLDGIVVSHGHPDHCGDVPWLLRLHPTAWLAVGPGLRSWAEDLGLGGRLHVLGEEVPEVLGDVTVSLLPGIHVGEGLGTQLRSFAGYALRRPVSAAQLLAESLRAPRGAANAVVVQLPEGTVLHAAETLHDATDFGRWAAQIASWDVDVLLLGVEPGQEEGAAQAAAAVGAERVIGFSPHQRQRDHFRVRRDVSWSRVRRGVPLDRTVTG